MKKETLLRRALTRLIFEAESRAGVPKAEIARARAALNPPKPTALYLHAIIQENSGEKSFTFDVIKQLPLGTDLAAAAGEIAAKWYDEPDLDENDKPVVNEEDEYSFNCGETSVSVYRWKEISPENFEIIREYITPLA